MKTNTERRQYFESLIKKAEAEIAVKPEAYRKRLKLLAYLGYGIIFLMLALLLAIIGGTAWAALGSTALFLLLIKKKFIFVLIGLVWVIGRSIFIKIEEPQGYELSREDFPHVWKEVDRLSMATDAPKVHRIVMTPEMNAAMAQTPRFGLLGFYKNTLIIGLEIMLALSEEQLRSVLAHELAHLSGSHSKFSSWIYRIRASWLNIHSMFQRRSVWGTGLISRFVSWYEPYFSGYSYVLARDNEYEADALAAKITTPESTASALVTVHASGEVVNDVFWKPFYEKAYKKATPAKNVYTALKRFYELTSRDHPAYQQSLRLSLKSKPHVTDTHPSLSQRLEALKCPDAGFDATGDSAVKWLGHQSDTVFEYFNDMWSFENKERWEAFHQAAIDARQEIEGYASRDYDALSAQEKWQYADLTDRFLPDSDALPLFLRYKSAHPEDMDADLVVGRMLLENNDPKGMIFIKKSSTAPHLRTHAADIALGYYSRHNDEQEEQKWLLEYESARDVLEAAEAERSNISHDDTLIAPGLTEDEELDLLGELHLDKKVKEVWIAQKQVKHFPDSPVYVISVISGGFIYDKTTWFESLLGEYQTEKSVFITSKVTNAALTKAVVNKGVQLF